MLGRGWCGYQVWGGVGLQRMGWSNICPKSFSSYFSMIQTDLKECLSLNHFRPFGKTHIVVTATLIVVLLNVQINV